MKRGKIPIKWIALTLIALIICGSITYIAVANPDIFKGIITIIYQSLGGDTSGDGNNNNNNNNNNGNNTNNNTPHIGTWIHLDNPVDECDRDDYVTFSVTSDFANVPVSFVVKYGNVTAWSTVFTWTLNSGGSCNQQVKCENAGFWYLQVRHITSGVFSNEESITVKGITIYQQKASWYANESYTGALTGTYKTWQIAVFYKDIDSTIWTFHTFILSDADGKIDYGDYFVMLNPLDIGKSKNVIAVIDPKSGGDYGHVCDLLEQYEGNVPNDAIDNECSLGLLVKSNILTFSVVA